VAARRRSWELRTALLAAVVLLLAAVPARAATTTVTFDDLPPGTTVDDQYRDSHGVYFRGPDAGDGWFPVIASAPAQAHSGTQVADISQCTAINCEGFSPRSTGRLTNLAQTVAVYVGFTGGGAADITLTAFNSSGTPLGSQTTTAMGGQPFTQLSVTTPSASADIAAFDVSGPTFTAGIAIDDVTITTPEIPPPPDFSIAVASDPANVPEGDSVSVPISINRLNNSNGDIVLSASGLPPGLSASFSPNPLPGTNSQATLTLTAESNATASVDYNEISITGTPSAGAGGMAHSASKLVRIVGNCARQVRLDFIDARTTTGCLRSSGSDLLVATDTSVYLNGLQLEPTESGTRLIINKRDRTITSDGKEIRVAPIDHHRIKLYEGEIDWNLGGTGNDPKQVIDNPSRLIVDAGGEEPLVDLFLFFRVDRITVFLTKAGKAQVYPTLKFGFWPFNYFGSGTTTSTTTGFSTDNDNGSSFNALAFKLDKVNALGIELKNVSFGYQSGGTLSGGATLVLRFAKPYEIGAAFGLKQGDFDYLRASVGGLNTPIATGIFLQRIGLEVQRNPLQLQGTAAFSAGPEIAGVQWVTVNGSFKAVLDDPFVIELSGNANLIEKYFGTRFQLASAFVRYSSTGLFEFSGDQNWDLKVAYASGHIGGWVDGLDAASLEGRERVCIRVPLVSDPCAGAGVIASSIGIAACVEASFVKAGVGYKWRGDFDLWWGSCDLGPWRPIAGGSAHTAAAERRVRLRPGLPSAAFAVDGEGAAPDLTLSGPHGERISVSAAKPQARVGRMLAMKGEEQTTYVYVARPSAGTWTLHADGATQIRSVRQSFGLPRPSAHARVRGHGRRRTLEWRLRPIPGQRVRFVEFGRDVRNAIKATNAARGRVAFTPADGPAGRRRIVAMVEQNGRPRTTLTAGSYIAPPRRRPGRPRKARIARRGSRLIVSWRARVPGFRHAVSVDVGDGRTLELIARAGAKSVTVPGVPRGYGARAAIMGITKLNARGPAARVTLAATAPRPAAGRWTAGTAFGYIAAGRFELSRGGRALARLRLTPSPAEADRCGAAELQVAGKRKLTTGKVAGRAVWIVGKRAPAESDGANPVPVRATQAGKAVNATLELTFDRRTHATGELRFGGCRIYFEARR
jgi:hypothetical protein